MRRPTPYPPLRFYSSPRPRHLRPLPPWPTPSQPSHTSTLPRSTLVTPARFNSDEGGLAQSSEQLGTLRRHQPSRTKKLEIDAKVRQLRPSSSGPTPSPSPVSLGSSLTTPVTVSGAISPFDSARRTPTPTSLRPSNLFPRLFALCWVCNCLGFRLGNPFRAYVWTHKSIGFHQYMLSDGLSLSYECQSPWNLNKTDI